MSTPDLSAIAKWPNVPACYDWLSLDRRGRWRLQGQPVTHGGLISFINRQYGCDQAGNWFLQNGPQRVFVELEYTPWVWHLDPDGILIAHTGEIAGPASAIWLDEEGSILLQTGLGIGLLDDRDLPAFLAACRTADGTPADDATLMASMDGLAEIFWNGLAIAAITSHEVPTHFRFQPAPTP